MNEAISTLQQQLSSPQVWDGLIQVGVATLLALIVLGISILRKLKVESEVAVAFVRGFVQVVAAGSILGLILVAPLPLAGVVLAAMVVIAAWISQQRAGGVPGAFYMSIISIGFGAALVVSSMTAVGVIAPDMRSLVPVGSMIIANAMRTNSLALDQFRRQIATNAALIEAGLALGASPGYVVAPFMASAVRSSLVPEIDTLRSLGIVFLPGLMAGMILSGANPIYASEYQFVIMAMIFAASALTSMAVVALIQRNAFTHADQLAIRGQP